MARFPWSKRTREGGMTSEDVPEARAGHQQGHRAWGEFIAGLMKDRLDAGRQDVGGECDLYLGFLDVAQAEPVADRLAAELGNTEQLPFRARRIAGLLALCLQGSLLLRHAPQTVADAFCASRLGGDWGAVLGTLPAGTAVGEIIQRAGIGAV